MGTFLLVLFILFFVLPRILGFLLKYKMRKTINNIYEQQQRQQQQQQQQRYNSSTPTQQYRKKIGNDVGEYISFEEIADTPKSDNHNTPRQSSDVVEPQISDAEWEEIK